MSQVDFYRPSFFPRTLFMHRIGSLLRIVTLGFYRNWRQRRHPYSRKYNSRRAPIKSHRANPSDRIPRNNLSRVASNKTRDPIIRNRSLDLVQVIIHRRPWIRHRRSRQRFRTNYTREKARRGGGRGRRRRERERERERETGESALILGQRPTSPKGA